MSLFYSYIAGSLHFSGPQAHLQESSYSCSHNHWFSFCAALFACSVCCGLSWWLFSRAENRLFSTLENSLFSTLENRRFSTLENRLFSTLENGLFSILENRLFSTLENSLFSTLENRLFSTLENILFPTLENSHQDRPQHTEHANKAAQKLNQWLCEQLYELSLKMGVWARNM